MKIDYGQASDILSMLFSSTPVEETDEVKPGVIQDCDAAGNVVGIEILDACDKATKGQRGGQRGRYPLSGRTKGTLPFILC
jgi:uncharacterized protein YuzE